MPAIPLPLVTPWHRAALQAVAGWIGRWRTRRPPVDPAELASLDAHMLRDMGLPEWLRHDLAERRQTRTVERIASGLPAEWSR